MATTFTYNAFDGEEEKESDVLTTSAEETTTEINEEFINESNPDDAVDAANKTETESKEDDRLMSEYKELADYIKQQLEQRASTDELFAQNFAKSNKSIKECIKYIVGEAFHTCTKVGRVGLKYISPTDIVSMAIHYYDEDDIKVREIQGAAATRPTTTASTTSTAAPKAKPTATAAPPIVSMPPKPKTEAQKRKEKKEKAQAAIISMFDDSFFN